jgi:hypothetical protein
MSVVISSSYVLADSTSGGGIVNADNPVVGWRTIATAGTLTTTTAADGFPASNMANPATHLRWVGEVSDPVEDEHVAVSNPDVADVDYIAIARHNLGSAAIPVSVEYLDVTADPNEWEELVEPVLLPDDGPALFRFSKLAYAAVRLRLQPGTAAPTIAVLYAGELLTIQRRLYVGHTPINMGRELTTANPKSIAGNFLGRIVLGERRRTSVALRNLTPDWYRANMEPFIKAAEERPFFWAWRPGAYPLEVGYCWLPSDPTPKNQLGNGMMQIDLTLEGIA